MIEINLLPEELKVKTKEKVAEPVVTVTTTTGFSLNKLFVYAIPVLLVFFVLVHLYFGVISIFENGKLVSLNLKLMALAPQKKILDEFNQQYSAASQDASLTQLLIGQRILWAQKLNKLSLNLPAGVWFNDVSLSKLNVTIQGSVISLQKEELNLINKFLDNLRSDKEFFKDFSNFELSNVQRRTVGSYDIVDFVLVGALKAK